jgi:hypothetical protein
MDTKHQLEGTASDLIQHDERSGYGVPLLGGKDVGSEKCFEKFSLFPVWNKIWIFVLGRRWEPPKGGTPCLGLRSSSTVAQMRCA